MNNVRKKYMPYLPFILFFCYALFLLRQSVMVSGGDDGFYRTALEQNSLFGWCREYYMCWSGRVPIHLFDIAVLNLPIMVWRICCSFVYTLLAVYIARFTGLFCEHMSEEQVFFRNIVSCSLLLLLRPGLLDDILLGMTSSVNYLWPVASLLIVLYPFIALSVGKRVEKWEPAAAFFAQLFACYCEQTAAVYMVMTLFCLLYVIITNRKKDIPGRIPVIYWVLAAAGYLHSVILYAAPGNYVRYHAEVLAWYPSFDSYGLMDKIGLGILHFFKEMFSEGKFYIFIPLLLLGIFYSKKDRIYQLLYCAVWLLSLVIYRMERGISDAVIWDIYSGKELMRLFAIIFWILLVAFLLLEAAEHLIKGIFLSLLFLAAVAAIVVIGFSPTVYASGLRVYFLSYVLLILTGNILFTSILQYIPLSRSASRHS